MSHSLVSTVVCFFGMSQRFIRPVDQHLRSEHQDTLFLSPSIYIPSFFPLAIGRFWYRTINWYPSSGTCGIYVKKNLVWKGTWPVWRTVLAGADIICAMAFNIGPVTCAWCTAEDDFYCLFMVIWSLVHWNFSTSPVDEEFKCRRCMFVNMEGVAIVKYYLEYSRKIAWNL